ncbi:MAG: APC family permease, partial [Vulcanimicrobiaceae bacterium]
MIRAIGLRGALAVNLITMVGIGPLVTIPLIVTLLPGPSALFAWGLGALVALCDGLGWAELGALYPQAGGTYAYLREAYGAEGPGRLLAFSYAWLVLFATPPLLASGYLGFARYAAYFWPPLATDATLQGLLAALVGLVTLAILWRTIGTVDATNLVLAFATLATLAAIALAAAARFAASRAFGGGPPHLAATLGMALGPALVIALYDYTGYGAACTLGEEVRAPSRTLPRAVVGAILLVAVA